MDNSPPVPRFQSILSLRVLIFFSGCFFSSMAWMAGRPREISCMISPPRTSRPFSGRGISFSFRRFPHLICGASFFDRFLFVCHPCDVPKLNNSITCMRIPAWGWKHFFFHSSSNPLPPPSVVSPDFGKRSLPPNTRCLVLYGEFSVESWIFFSFLVSLSLACPDGLFASELITH